MSGPLLKIAANTPEPSRCRELENTEAGTFDEGVGRTLHPPGLKKIHRSLAQTMAFCVGIAGNSLGMQRRLYQEGRSDCTACLEVWVAGFLKLRIPAARTPLSPLPPHLKTSKAAQTHDHEAPNPELHPWILNSLRTAQFLLLNVLAVVVSVPLCMHLSCLLVALPSVVLRRPALMWVADGCSGR